MMQSEGTIRQRTKSTERKEENTMEEKRCYTVKDLQTILDISRPTVYLLLQRKEFRWIRLQNGVYRISKNSFDEWLDKGVITDKMIS